MPANTIITVRKGSSSAWVSANPVLASGELGFDTTNNILKIGNGTSDWNSLSNHRHSSADITNFNSGVSGLLPSISGSGYISSNFVNNIYTISLSGLQPSGNYSLVGHTHASADITDFDTRVSGLLIPYQLFIVNPITGTGTSGYLTRFNSNSSLINSIIYESGSNIGINTINPSYQLDVSGSIRTLRSDGNEFFYYERPGVGNGGLAISAGSTTFRSSLPYRFLIGGNDHVRIDSSGNVGIGTTTPSGKLHIGSGDLHFDSSYGLRWAGGSRLYEERVGVGGGSTERMLYLANGDRFEVLTENGVNFIAGFHGANSLLTNSIRLYRAVGVGSNYAASGSLPINGLAVQGNVGIGTQSPVAPIHVIGSGIYSTSDSSSIITIDPSGRSIDCNPSAFSDISLKANNQFIFRGLDGWTGTWSDSAITTYFQVGRNAGNTIFTSLQGAAFNRLGYSANKILFTNSNSNLSIPSGYFTINTNINGGSVGTSGLVIDTMHSSSTANGQSHGALVVTSLFNTVGSNLNNIYGAYIAPRHSGVYTTTNSYGLYVNAATNITGTITNNYAAVFNGGNVGIGTNNPTMNLHVAGSGYISNALGINNTIQSNFALDVNGNVAFRNASIYTNGSLIEYGNQRFQLNAGPGSAADSWVSVGNGRFGVGTTNPQTLIHASGLATGVGSLFRLQNGSSSNNTYFETRIGTPGNFDDYIFFNRNGTNFFGATNNSELFFPNTTRLASNKPIVADPNGNAVLNLYNASAQTELGYISGNALRFLRSYVEVARFDGNGNFGIGTTTPSGQLHVIGSGIFSSGILFGDNTLQTTAYVSGQAVPASHGSTHATNSFDPIPIITQTPSQLTGDQNNYVLPSGDIVRLSSDATRTITGFQAISGAIKTIYNVGNFDIRIDHQDTNSDAANRVISSTAQDIVLAPNDNITIVYDAVSSRWRTGGVLKSISQVSIYEFTRVSSPPDASGSLGSYTWTPPANAKLVEIFLIAGGGGGSSGRRGASATNRYGGGGGGSGGAFLMTVDRSLINTPLTISVGGGGAGGASVSTDDTNGNSGSSGGATTVTFNNAVNTLFTAWGAAGATGGTNSAGAGGLFTSNNATTFRGGTGQSAALSNLTTAVPGDRSISGPAGIPGAAGGSISTGDVVFTPGTVRNQAPYFALSSAQTGADSTGGAASITANASSGSNGASYGYGGCGGGASANGFASGAGGNGGDGYARIIVYY